MNIVLTHLTHIHTTHNVTGTHGDPSGGFGSWCANKLSFSSLGLLSSSSPHQSQVIAGGEHRHNEPHSRRGGGRKGLKWRWSKETEEATNTLLSAPLSATCTKMSFWHDTKEPLYLPPVSSFCRVPFADIFLLFSLPSPVPPFFLLIITLFSLQKRCFFC